MDAIFAVTARHLPTRRPQRPAAPRRGFTLVEMLTVIVIIGILASLITGAVIAARIRAREVAVALEISQLEAALKAYKAKYGEYPPDFSAANPADREAAVVRHLSKAFPRIDLGAVNTTNAKFGVFASRVSAACGLDVSKLDPSSALVFWLAGLPDGAGSKKLVGFSANARNPFDATSASRTQPLFEFDPQRLRIENDVIQYFPDTGGSGENAPYVYFRPRNGNYAGKSWDTVTPFEDTRTNEWVKPREFQILSAGLDGIFGAGSKFPTGEDYTEGAFDNITNFSEGTLEDKM